MSESGEQPPYQPYGGAPYAGNPYGGAPAGPSTDPVSITGFVLSLLCCTSVVGLVLVEGVLAEEVDRGQPTVGDQGPAGLDDVGGPLTGHVAGHDTAAHRHPTDEALDLLAPGEQQQTLAKHVHILPCDTRGTPLCHPSTVRASQADRRLRVRAPSTSAAAANPPITARSPRTAGSVVLVTAVIASTA
jgi:hypothetical protein